MLTDESWFIRFETSDDTTAFETALTEICSVLAVSVSRPYLDAPYWVVEGFCDFAPDEALVASSLSMASPSGTAPEFSIIAHGKRDWLAENRASFPALHIGRFWIYGSHITELARLREEAREKGAWSAAINAEVARGKAAGLYIEQKIIKHGKLEDLSERELEARLSEIIEDNKLLLEHEDVETLKEKVKKPTELKLVKPVEEVLDEDS